MQERFHYAVALFASALSLQFLPPFSAVYSRGVRGEVIRAPGLSLDHQMDSAALVGRSILILEDEPLIALDICEGLKSAGASVFMAHCLRDALALAHHPDLSAAILDFGLNDGDASPVCERLNRRHIPFLLYSGYENAAARGVTLRKPATQAELVETLARLLSPRAPAAQESARRA